MTIMKKTIKEEILNDAPNSSAISTSTATSTIDEETLYNLCQYGVLRYNSDDEYNYSQEYDLDEYDDDDDEDDDLDGPYWYGGKNPSTFRITTTTTTITSTALTTAAAARHRHLNFTEYDSEDDEIPLNSSKAERDRRRRNRKQIRRIAKQKRTDSGVLLIDRFSDLEFEALLQALLLLKQPQQPSTAQSQSSDSAEYYKELLTTVRVRRNSREWTRSRTLEQIKELFVIISTSIPDLQHLDVTGFDSTNDEIEIIANSLCGHPTLQKLDIDTLNFDPRILQALETIPHLQYVGLDMRDSTPLAPLLASSCPTSLSTSSPPCSTVKHLKLSSYNYFFYNNEDAALDMIESIKSNTTLETLEIKLICDSMVKALVEMLRYNANLKHLTFAALLDGDQTKANDFFVHLSDALQQNKTLKSLIIGNEMDVGYDGQNAILDMLCHRNNTLEQLHFDWWRPATITTKTMHPRKMQERRDFEASKNFFLKHNQMKTKRLLLCNQYTTNHWIDALSEHSDHVKSLYYLLRMNPSTFFNNSTNNNKKQFQKITTATTTADADANKSKDDDVDDLGSEDESWWMTLD